MSLRSSPLSKLPLLLLCGLALLILAALAMTTAREQIRTASSFSQLLGNPQTGEAISPAVRRMAQKLAPLPARDSDGPGERPSFELNGERPLLARHLQSQQPSWHNASRAQLSQPPLRTRQARAPPRV